MRKEAGICWEREGGCGLGAACVHRGTSVSRAALAAGTGPQGQVGSPSQPAWPVCGWGGLAQPGLQVCQVWGLGPMRALRALGLGHLAWLMLGHFHMPPALPAQCEREPTALSWDGKQVPACQPCVSECLLQAAGAVGSPGLVLGVQRS